MNKVIHLCSFRSVYNSNLQKELEKRDTYSEKHKTEVIYFDEQIESFENEIGLHYINLNFIEKVRYWNWFNKFLFERFSFDKNRDIVNIQYVDFRYLFIIKFLRNNFRKIILSFWGSDLLRQSQTKLHLMRRLFQCADIITFETKEMAEIFQNRVGRNYYIKIKEVKFGLSILDLIDKITDNDIIRFCDQHKIDADKFIIVIGYNRIWQQQHLLVTESIKRCKLPSDKIFIIFPWTYGYDDDNYKSKIVNEVEGIYDYLFLTEKMEDYGIACLRKITDILVQVQTSDSLSATMLETLYAGKYVITGDWLPYNDIIQDGLLLNLVGDPSDVGECIRELMKNGKKKVYIEKNHQKVYALSSWDVNIEHWIELYD